MTHGIMIVPVPSEPVVGLTRLTFDQVSPRSVDVIR